MASRYGYTLPEPVAARFDEIFMRLRAEAFWNHSIAHRTHDAFLANALGRRLRPELDLGAAPAELDALRAQIVALYADSYGKALALAEAGVGGAAAGGLIAEARGQSRRLQERLNEFVQGLVHRLHTSPQIFSPSRAAAAGAVAFAFLGGTLPGCGTNVTKGEAGADAYSNSADAAEASAPDAPGADAVCTPTPGSLLREYENAALQAVPCFSGHISFWLHPGNPNVTVSLGNDVYECSSSVDGGSGFAANLQQWPEQVKNAISGLPSPCYDPGPPFSPSWSVDISVTGGAATQVEQIRNALTQCGGPELAYPEPYGFILDEVGRVVGTSGLSDEVSSCLLQALAGLSFPCLAGAQLCVKDTVIIE